MRSIRYQQIAEELRGRVLAGDFAAGRMLPSESELSAEFSASRVTVRRALEVLRDEGLVDARQGFGWFVAGDPLRQPLGRLATIEEQMAESGVVSERRILEFAFERAPKFVTRVLNTPQVLRVKRLNMADGEPFAIVTVWCPADLGQHLSRRDVEQSPFYELLDIPLQGATQTIAADAATDDDAKLLQVPVGSPVLRCERVTSDATGRAVLLSRHVFPGHRTEFVVDLPQAAPSIAPTGLRLVD
ncbi:MAG: GntR family transcriptional regulator [Actinobacteria bacterium]|nr:GntR family transcriptional regulator [Actinomycetota bacterium]NBP53253.1 GntR family transcriptional regulator [Actinomycetota bacterium]